MQRQELKVSFLNVFFKQWKQIQKFADIHFVSCILVCVFHAQTLANIRLTRDSLVGRKQRSFFSEKRILNDFHGAFFHSQNFYM